MTSEARSTPSAYSKWNAPKAGGLTDRARSISEATAPATNERVRKVDLQWDRGEAAQMGSGYSMGEILGAATVLVSR